MTVVDDKAATNSLVFFIIHFDYCIVTLNSCLSPCYRHRLGDYRQQQFQSQSKNTSLYAWSSSIFLSFSVDPNFRRSDATIVVLQAAINFHKYMQETRVGLR